MYFKITYWKLVVVFRKNFEEEDKKLEEILSKNINKECESLIEYFFKGMFSGKIKKIDSVIYSFTPVIEEYISEINRIN